MKRPLLTGLLLLAACGTPQEQCISQGTQDLRVLDRLIAETEKNVARGYGYENVTVVVQVWKDCTPKATDATPTPKPKMCLEEETETTSKAVAIDLDAERAKLTSMKSKRAQLAKAATSLVAQCKAKYPE